MSRTTVLLNLQRIDSRRDEIAGKHKRVVVALGGDAKLRQARKELDAAATALHEVDRQLRALELERRSMKDHIATEERKLYGGTIKSPKELQGFDREVASLKRQMAALDDQALEHLLARDDAIARRDTAQGELETAEAKFSQNHDALERQRDALAAAANRLDKDRAKAAAAIPECDLALYEHLRATKAGRAVAALGAEGCSECGIELPRHTRDRASDGDAIILCPGCGRILHA